MTLLLCSTAKADNYEEARRKATEALMIQSGASEFLMRFRLYGEGRAAYYMNKLGIANEAMFISTAYIMYTKHEISFPIKDIAAVTVRPYQASIEIKL